MADVKTFVATHKGVVIGGGVALVGVVGYLIYRNRSSSSSSAAAYSALPAVGNFPLPDSSGIGGSTLVAPPQQGGGGGGLFSGSSGALIVDQPRPPSQPAAPGSSAPGPSAPPPSPGGGGGSGGGGGGQASPTPSTIPAAETTTISQTNQDAARAAGINTQGMTPTQVGEAVAASPAASSDKALIASSGTNPGGASFKDEHSQVGVRPGGNVVRAV